LEKHYQAFENSTLDELILHGLRALRDTVQQDKDLSLLNTSLAVIGPERKFYNVEGDALDRYLKILEADPKPVRAVSLLDDPAPVPAGEMEVEQPAAEDDKPAPMDVE
jgi:20S proteasome subunit alpha 6